MGASPNNTRAALSRIIGNYKTDNLANALPSATLLLDLFSLAPGFSVGHDKGSSYCTVDRYVDHLREKRPSVFESIQSISRLTGKACREQVAIVVTTLAGQDNRTHDSVIYAIILSIIGKTDYDKKSLVEAAIHDFILCPNDHRPILIQKSETGKLINMPSPITAVSSLYQLPGFLALNPATNPLAFNKAWEDLFVVIVNLLCFEAITKNNIGALEKDLQLFNITPEEYLTHPFVQLRDEPMACYAARIYQAHRAIQAACEDAQCPELTPTPARLIALLYNCVHHSIWDIAETLIKEHNLKPKTFHEALEIMFTAEQRLSHQDPQVTLAQQLRAKALPSISSSRMPSSAPPMVPSVTFGSLGTIPSSPSVPDSCPYRLLLLYAHDPTPPYPNSSPLHAISPLPLYALGSDMVQRT